MPAFGSGAVNDALVAEDDDVSVAPVAFDTRLLLLAKS